MCSLLPLRCGVLLQVARTLRTDQVLLGQVIRTNAAWAERQGGWLSAMAVQRSDYQDSGDMHIYKAEAIKRLRAGQVR